MGKVGRNNPCPCGSGKKYKKCCLAKDEAAAIEATARIPRSSGLGAVGANLPGDVDLHPYVIAKMADDPETRAEVDATLGRKARRKLWTPSQLGAMSTDEIEKRLRDLGVDPSRDRFLELPEGYTSAWELSDVWREEIPRGRWDAEVDDFVGLAACELWKRHSPDRPSVEMLDDWMQDGYMLDMSNRCAEAASLWSKLWRVLSGRFTPGMTTFDDADVLVAGTQCVGNWMQDFLTTLRNVSIDEPAYAEKGVEVIEQALEQFSDEAPRERAYILTEHAFFYFRLGQDEAGEKILVDIIAKHGDWGGGYACLSDNLSDTPPGGSQPRDLDRAISLLEQALARPVADPEDWDLERRLEYLREMSAASGDKGGATEEVSL
jgi:hypothetical protein